MLVISASDAPEFTTCASSPRKQTSLATTTNYSTMADTVTADAGPAPKPKKKSIFSTDAIAPMTEGAKALDFFSRGRDTFERTLEENKRKQERQAARLERKRSSTSADLKENSPVEEKRRKLSAQKSTGTGYSSEEGSQHEDEDGMPPRKRSVIRQSAFEISV